MSKNLFAARRVLSLCLLLSLCSAASAASVTNIVFSDDFESGQILFPVGNWTVTTANTLDISTPTNVVPGGGIRSAFMNTSIDRMHRNLGGEFGGHLLFTFYFYDEGTNGGTVGATRAYNEIRGHSGGSGLPNGGTVASGSLDALIAAGKFNATTLTGEVFTATKYQGRVAFGPAAAGTTGVFNLNGAGSPNRSIGWHRFDIEVLPPGSTIKFYVDGILSRTFNGAAVDTYDTVILGPGLGTQLGGGWFDGVRFAQIIDPPVNITCPPNLTVAGTGPGGATVGFFVSAGGGCTPPTISCVPPTGANFPIGTTTVNCTASDTCGQTANCSFTIQVLQPGGPEVFTLTNNLPPAAGEYVSPAQWHQLYANGIIISNSSHDRFVNPGISNVLYGPPGPGLSNSHPFNSTATFQISADNGVTFQTVSAPAAVVVGVGHIGTVLGKDFFATEMQSFDIQGGSLPPGVMIRESPTLASTGQTTVRSLAGGYMIGSFFDIFTEVSLDGGANWSPALTPVHVELKKSITAPPVDEPTDLLPPPNDQYVSPDQWHALYAVGIVISNVSHSGFLQSYPAGGNTGLPGGTNTENFGSTVDMDISLDGGVTFTAARVSAPVTVTVADAGSGTYDTEMTALSLSGGDLPLGVMVRESPTEPSRGRTRVIPMPDGTFKIASFFDIFTEVSLDNGGTWNPATNGPVHVELRSKAPEKPFTSPDLPPAGQYVSPQDWHAYFAMGIYITNVSHLDFLQHQPPPPPGGSQPHAFGSAVQMQVSMDGGVTFNPVTAQANVMVNVSSTTMDTATTRFFDTEMLQLNLNGGSLPPGMMIRESPTKASTGKTSIRQAAPGDYRISSFFDIFVELSLDGGATWHPSLSGPASVSVTTLGGPPPVTIACPANVTVNGAAGTVVNYPPPTVGGGCTPPTVVCSPPSGSPFPLGTTTVNCTASDTCGGSATCSFNVTVNPPVPPAPEIFFPTPNLPPPTGTYISPALYHQLYANGIIISNISHNKFTQSTPPPPPNTVQVHTFGSSVSMDISTDGGSNFVRHTAPAGVAVQVTHTPGGPTQQFATEMQQLDIAGGTLPVGVIIRESPTLPSPGHTTMRTAPGGFMISSFFDVFTELSLDGGASWSPALQPAHVELRRDVTLTPPVSAPTGDLPPRNGAYVSPADYHILTAQGVVISNVSHSFFTHSQPPPPVGGTAIHTFNSQVDMDLSFDGGATFQSVRAPAGVEVRVDGTTGGTFDTEMLSLNIQGGDLPPAVRLRESPTLPSRGRTSIAASGVPIGDPDFDLLRIGSFFDIFVEVSLDGGQNWSPAQAPAHVQLVMPAPEQPATNSNLPPLNGEYISPERWHQLYANGIIISNASHDRFTQSQPPPPPGGSQVHNFGSMVHFDLIQQGQAPVPMTAPASVTTQVSSSQDSGSTRFFDTEMLALNISAPGGIMVRESPSKASLGRTSIRTTPTDYRVGSFFDIFTEMSLDGGATWSPAVSGPVSVHLNIPNNPPLPLAITCPPNMTVIAPTAAGAVVNYPPPAVSGGCAPVSVVCVPPSGSPFPIGTTTLTCVVTDGCGGSANCSFSVTVRPPIPDIPFNDDGLPPTNGMYISPQLYHQLYANGIIIRSPKHRYFTQSTPPPAPGTIQVHEFDSQVDCEISVDGGLSFQSVSAPAAVSVSVYAQPGTGQVRTFDTEMLQLDISGGNLPPGIRLRESPTLASPGLVIIRGTGFGNNPDNVCMISFFDIFTEVSLDGGATWSAAAQAAHVELRKDPTTVPPVDMPTGDLPPPNGAYVSPQDYHLALASGIVISNVSHSFFTGSQPPPPLGGTNTHTFDSQVDMMLSTDGGLSFSAVRAPAAVTVRVHNIGSSGNDGVSFDTEMLQLDLSGGALPPGLLIRESPTKQSIGGTSIAPNTNGTHRIHSFFDIFVEVSLDGGASWTPAPAPAHVELVNPAAEQTVPTPNLPPLNGEYVSPDQWHQLYANGIIISNASHDRFTQNQPPPPPGGSQVHNFGSMVTFDLFQPGQPPAHVTAPASVTAQVSSSLDSGSTRFFDTEMLALNISGGALPGGVQLRESPTKQSLGRTSIRTTPGDYRVSSFFDIFTEISLDGGATWSPAVSGPVSVQLNIPTNPPPPLAIACPPNVSVTAPTAAGVVVNYPAPIVSGGCAPFNVVCNPPSGSPFPVGTTTVTCVVTDGCGQSATCSFTVTVRARKPRWFPTPLLPPPQGEYISPQQWHQFYANGIIISNVSHRHFLQSFPPPATGTSETHSFGSTVELLLSTDGGTTFTPATAPADVTVQVTHVGTDPDGTQLYDTEMLALNLASPGGFMIRESPTRASTGRTTVQAAPGGGFAIDSFFDVFTELSLDGGANWSPAQEAAQVELRTDPRTITPIPASTQLLPPPNDLYVSPQQYHLLLAQGIQIRNVRHKFFTQSQPPPPPGPGAMHTFGSQVDMEVSLDGGQTFQPRRAPAAVAVHVQHRGTAPDETQLYDTEMLQLDLQGGDLPVGVMLRESPTRASQGGTVIAPTPNGHSIGSFFDIFVDLSVDGGQTWTPAPTPARVELICEAPPMPVPNPNLPPLNGQYISPQQWHALYAQGIIISNVSHKHFTQSFPPPPPGVTETHSFGSDVECDLSLNNGTTWQHTTLPAQVTVSVREMQSDGDTRFFETEMLALNISGGGLPVGMMVRESPSKASLGRTSIRTSAADGTHSVASFFDIFTELSADGGQTWQPSLTGPANVHVVPNPVPCTVLIVCPANITAFALTPAGRVVTFAPTVGPVDTCGAPVTYSCTPPSGSNFPVGTTTVTCTASSVNGSASCSFTVTVRPRKPRWFPTPLLPPQQGEYVSPQQWHQLYANGIIISNVSHRRFLQSFPPPPPGGSQIHTFPSQVSGQVSSDGGQTWSPLAGAADVTVQVTHVGVEPSGTQVYDTEMLALNLSSPGGLMIRESPTRASIGRTAVQSAPGGGFMIDSFFDVFTELSLDGGATWSPGEEAAPVQLGRDPLTVPSVPAGTQLLPPPNDLYVSPALYHILTAQGIVIRDVKHKFFTQSLPPPPPGSSQTHTFGSQVDMEVSQDGGVNFVPMRAPAQVEVSVRHRGTESDGTQVYDTEMLQLDIQGGDLPPSIRLRESPTRQSHGGTAIAPQSDGTSRIGSFFDVFVELSLDGGQNWAPVPAAAHVELICEAPEQPASTPNLPPLNGQYISPQQWHQLYANGIIISNASHERFLTNSPPPPPGGSVTHGFGSMVTFDLHQGGQQPIHVTAPAAVTTRVTSSQDSGDTRFFDTEMLALNISGGSLPNGVMVRESPSKASLGRTSIRTSPTGAPYRIGSFFDIFTEISLDGGQNWSPAVSGPASMHLNVPGSPCVGPASLAITRSPDGTSVTISWTGTGFRLQCTTALSGPGTTVWTDVPGASGVTLPVEPGVNKFYRVICP